LTVLYAWRIFLAPAHEGRHLEAILRWSSRAVVAEIRHVNNGGPEPEGNLRSRGACGRVRTPPPGGSGGPAALTTKGRLQWLHVSEMNGGESLPDAGSGRKVRSLSAGRSGPETKIAASGAPDGERADRKARVRLRRRTLKIPAPFGAPSPRVARGASPADERQTIEGLPGADQRIRAMTRAYSLVIPGRAKGASPESIFRSRADAHSRRDHFDVSPNTGCGVWMPGSPLTRLPGMTAPFLASRGAIM
jgi:hypothetical protein